MAQNRPCVAFLAPYVAFLARILAGIKRRAMAALAFLLLNPILIELWTLSVSLKDQLVQAVWSRIRPFFPDPEVLQAYATRFGIQTLKASWFFLRVLAVVSVSFVFATLCYISVYMWMIPSTVLQFPVFFDYGPSHSPFAEPHAGLRILEPREQWSGSAFIDPPPKIRKMKPYLPYDVVVDLELPESPRNEELGMFMVYVKALAPNSSVLATCGRPLRLYHTSPLLKILRTAAFSALYLTGLKAETQSLSVRCMNEFALAAIPAQVMNVSISSPQLEVYSASLRLEAQLKGVRWLMHNFRLPMAALGIFVLTMLFSTIGAGVWVWQSLGADWASGGPLEEDWREIEEDAAERVRYSRRRIESLPEAKMVSDEDGESPPEIVPAAVLRPASKIQTAREEEEEEEKEREEKEDDSSRTSEGSSAGWEDAEASLNRSSSQEEEGLLIPTAVRERVVIDETVDV